MRPRLLLLTGPAAGDVAAVLSDEAASHYPATGTLGLSTEEIAQAQADERAAVGWWDEVRDYLDAPRSISDLFCGCKTATPEGRKAARSRAEAMGRAIRSLPCGETWLVGLVLPPPIFCRPGACTGRTHWDCTGCRNARKLPACLAILAPEPPPLLVERVRAWGGEEWHCQHDPDQVEVEGNTCRITSHTPGVGHDVRYQGYFATWPEAVAAALGEAP